MLFRGFPTKPHRAVLIDTPWNFVTWNRKRAVPSRTAEDPYKTLTFDELLMMPVMGAADLDCALFMWIVDTHVDQGIRLAEAWGFGFITLAFVWDKGDRIGMGHWTRKQAEFCYMFTRGKPKRLSAGVRQIIRAPRRENSRKPDEIYDRIEALVEGPYLELFARQRWPGWSAWGNEVTKFSPLREDLAALI